MNIMYRLTLAIVAAALSLPAAALDEGDVGTYAIVHIDGHVTDKLMRASVSKDRWIVEEQKPDGKWEDVTCEGGCRLSASTPADVERFLGKTPEGFTAECVHNSAFAFCRVTGKAKNVRHYAFVALTEKQPIALHLQKLSEAGK